MPDVKIMNAGYKATEDQFKRAYQATNIFNGKPNFNGYIKMVPVKCACCGEDALIDTEDFRLGWLCESCKDLPLLMKIVLKWSRSSGMRFD